MLPGEERLVEAVEILTNTGSLHGLTVYEMMSESA